jgi:hypothetical protein
MSEFILSVCRQRPCNGLIPFPGNPTECV